MKRADLDALIWLIIGAVVLLAKGWSKLQGQISKDSAGAPEGPREAPVRRTAAPGEGGRPKPRGPRPQPQPAPVGARPVAAPMRRGTQPVGRTAPRTVPSAAGTPSSRNTWQVDPEQIRRFMEQLSGQARPAPPPPIAQPPIQKAKVPAPPRPPPPAPAEPEPAPATASVTPPATASPTAPTTRSRASQWAEALRDRQNIRNIIIAYEIIGPPKGA